ncbi:serine hydrolase, partial [Xanthomonas perforans]
MLARIAEGVDAEDLAAHGISVRIGDDRAEHRWVADAPRNVYSVSKGVCAIAIGMAIDDGLLTWGTRVPELLGPLDLGAGVDEVTIEHLLRMRSGIDFAWFGHQDVPWSDLGREMLRRPAAGIGAVFQYSDASTYVAMRMLGEIVGDVRDWLVPRFFEPLGVA